MKKALIASILALSCGAVWASGSDDPVSGPFPSTAPSVSMPEFAKGRLGILDSSFYRIYLAVAWQALTDHPLPAASAKTLTTVLTSDQAPFPVEDWNKAVSAAGGTLPEHSRDWDGTRHVELMTGDSSTSFDYVNCTPDAVATAVKTLNQRVAAYGDTKHSPWIQNWIEGQVAVFQNCGSGQTLPAPAPAAAPLWLKQDRAYQAAAALFYSEQYDSAAKAFTAIGRDARSPWHDMAPYLAARSLLRKASLMPAGPSKTAALSAAKTAFTRLTDSSDPVTRERVAQLLRRIAIEEDRLQALRTLDTELGEQPWPDQPKAPLEDFLTLVRAEADQKASSQSGRSAGRPTSPHTVEGGMADWVTEVGLAPSLQPPRDLSSTDMAPDSSRACHLATSAAHRKPWVVACYMLTRSSQDIPSEVAQYANTLSVKDPAYATVTYHRLRLELAKASAPARKAAVREQIDKALSLGKTVFPVEAQNALHALRLPVSESVVQLLRHGQLVKFEDSSVRYAWQTEKPRTATKNVEWDTFAVQVLNNQLPVSTLMALAQNVSLAAPLRDELLSMAVARAALLHQEDRFAELRTLVSPKPNASAKAWGALLSAGPDTFDYELAHLLLKTEAPNPLFALADNASTWAFKYGKPLDYSSTEENRKARAETEALAALGGRTAVIGRAVLKWAAAHPQDSRLAQDLSDVIGLTRSDHDSPELHGISKQAWTVLHQLFPRSPQAARRKYFY